MADFSSHEEDMKRCRKVLVRVTTEEHDLIIENANAVGLSCSTYLRVLGVQGGSLTLRPRLSSAIRQAAESKQPGPQPGSARWEKLKKNAKELPLADIGRYAAWPEQQGQWAFDEIMRRCETGHPEKEAAEQLWRSLPDT